MARRCVNVSGFVDDDGARAAAIAVLPPVHAVGGSVRRRRRPESDVAVVAQDVVGRTGEKRGRRQAGLPRCSRFGGAEEGGLTEPGLALGVELARDVGERPRPARLCLAATRRGKRRWGGRENLSKKLSLIHFPTSLS